MTSAFDDRGVEHAPAGRDLADRSDQLVAVADAILEEIRVARRAVAQQRDRVLGLVVLRQHHHTGAGMLEPHDARRLDAFALEARRHADVGHQYIGLGVVGALQDAVVVLRHADHLEVGLQREQRPHTFADEQRVVGEEYRDPRFGHAPIRLPCFRRGKCARPRRRGCAGIPGRRLGSTHNGPTHFSLLTSQGE